MNESHMESIIVRTFPSHTDGNKNNTSDYALGQLL